MRETNAMRTARQLRSNADEPRTVEDVKKLEGYSDAIRKAWDSMVADPNETLNPRKQTIKPTAKLLEAYLKELFHADFAVNFWTEEDLPEKLSQGWVLLHDILTREVSRGFLLRTRMLRHADGTYRIGMGNELFVAVIRADVRNKLMCDLDNHNRVMEEVLKPRAPKIDTGNPVSDRAIAKSALDEPHPDVTLTKRTTKVPRNEE